MPGTLHQGILALFQEDPWLAFDVLDKARPADGTPVDRRGEVEHEGDKPWWVFQGFPDLVMVCGDPAKRRRRRGQRRGRRRGRRRRGIVIAIEAQAARDDQKRWIIPVYQALLAKKHRLETWAVVVSLTKPVSRAIRRWSTGGPPRVDVLLIDVDTVPKSPWLDEPARRPTAAVLAGILHGRAGDFEAARQAFQVTRAMGGERGRRHGLTILAALPEEQRQQLIGELPMHEQRGWIELERSTGTYRVGHREGLERGLEQGLERGLEQGLERGLEQGLERGRSTLIELIFELLDERGLVADAQAEARIRACEDLTILRRWVRQAMHASSLDALFDHG